MIDLMGNVTFTPHEINNRVVAIIRQRYSLEEEQKIARIAVGALQKTYTPTIAEKKLIADYQVYVEAARATGSQMSADNALLINTLAYEQAVARLAKSAKQATDKDADGNLLYPKVDELDPITGKPTGKKLTNPAIIQDKVEREAAQTIISSVSKATKILADERALNSQEKI